MSGAYRCITCRKEENDPNKIVLCAYCCKCEHLECKGVFGAAVESLRGKKFFCSSQCSEISLRTAESSATTDSLLMTEIKNVLTEVRGTKAELQKVQSTINEVQHANKDLGTKLDTLLTEMQTMKSDHKRLKDDVEVLQLQHCAMDETVSSLEVQVDRINRAALSKNAFILGVPISPNEDVMKLVKDIASAVGCMLPENAITEVKRLFPKDAKVPITRTAPIKVVFTEEHLKEELFAKKRAHGRLFYSTFAADSAETGRDSRIILQDELTSFGQKLLKEVRSIQEQADLKYVWPGRDGVILAKADEDSQIKKIRSTQDILKLQRSRPKRAMDSSLLHSTSISQTEEPRPKRHQQ